MNRLADSTSPYLRQHADNPVDWWPWGPEAFAEARRRDVPVFLSVGYATCHWCHVMARESFADPDIAAVINAGFVAVKVDREQHPGVDAVYMQATQALTGQGGWPMTVVTDADGRPFFAGTFFRSDQLRQLLAALTRTWDADRAQVDAVAGKLTAALAAAAEHGGTASWQAQDATENLPARIVAAGAGVVSGAPTFPPSAALLGLVRYAERTGVDGDAERDAALDRVGNTLHAMIRGGLFDQLGGGFHRYCVDDAWTVPHFEKTLYDNALLARGLSAYLARRPDDELVGHAAELTLRFLLTGLRPESTDGLFASGLDADTDGVEGLTYTWTPAEVVEVLGEDASSALAAYGVTDPGDVDGRSVLTCRGVVPGDDVRERLLTARARRAQPGVDDKVITAWNAMAAVALTESGDPEGVRATRALWDRVVSTDDDGTVLDVVRCPGTPESSGTLEDCAWLLLAMVRAAERGGAGQGVGRGGAGRGDSRGGAGRGDSRGGAGQGDGHGGQLLDEISELVSYTQLVFGRERGTWYDGAAPVAGTGIRPRDPFDGATPSGVAVLAEALTYAGGLATSMADADVQALGNRWMVEARRILDAHAENVEQHLASAGGWLCALEAHLAGPVTAVTRHASEEQAAALRAELGTSTLLLRVEDGAGLIGSLPDGDSDGASGEDGGGASGEDGDGGAALVQICRAGVCGVAHRLES
ncbi:thioredoxin domain-containing protein [Corynebacterium terpenotabidum]|uniref:Spermatogenesis-associated protein 20-like TRX domain-containing protein n=1 Tax=Corynebacterium terpenotabidum Y-11 TaxID=1200352 RepID=S4XDX7_9CORY|nr:thioredoxin domain-containing protein [Corynebacterium terpenotabidum]AGP30756.1 hypothetical protein A606_05545 [Corynebacterium terpenotabidum Y-11]